MDVQDSQPYWQNVETVYWKNLSDPHIKNPSRYFSYYRNKD